MRRTRLALALLAAASLSGQPCLAQIPESADANPLYSFFPFGMYLVGPDPVHEVEGDLAAKADFTCADLQAHDFNCVWANNLSIADHGAAWLSAGEKRGVKIILQGGGPPDLLRLEPPYTAPGTFEDRAYIDGVLIPHWTDLATKYRGSPALLAYSIDEECNPSPLARYRLLDRATRLIAALDPEHPAIVLYNQITSAELGAGMVKPKAIASDWYPFFTDPRNGPHTRGGSLSYFVTNQERGYRAARRAGGPFWIMAQGEGTDVLVKGRPTRGLYRMPGPNEMRWQVWCSLYCGAKGVFFYVYSTGDFEQPQFAADAAEGTELYWERGMVDRKGRESAIYREAAQVSREIDPLKPLFLKLDWAEPEENVIYWIESEYVVSRTFVHRGTGARYLVLFNSDPHEAHPAAVELNRFSQEVASDTKTYDVRARKLLSSEWPDQELKDLMIGPGDGAVILLLDKPDTLAKHREQYEQ
jgi:hypothetical protein